MSNVKDDRTHLLRPYTVGLFDYGCQLDFQCMAEDADHAFEQAENAYPDCIVRWASGPAPTPGADT
jgi:hypothetical protein